MTFVIYHVALSILSISLSRMFSCGKFRFEYLQRPLSSYSVGSFDLAPQCLLSFIYPNHQFARIFLYIP